MPLALSSLRGRGMNILIVDNDEAARRRAVEFFLGLGYQVQMVDSGLKAISLVIEQGVEAILMKAQLPGLSGLDAAAIIKRIDPKTRVIVVLQDESLEGFEETRQIDYLECFVEPLNLERVNQLLGGGR